MSEYWKSTPSYWCKFCSRYVRDTAVERKSHESSAQHQNNIQRSLRELHKGKEREERDKQRAKDEVRRLNGLVGGQTTARTPPPPPVSASPDVLAPSTTAATTAQQRIAHAEQLAAMGVELPEDLKKAITGVGSFELVAAQEVDATPTDAVTVHRSLADILAQERQEQSGIKAETVEGEHFGEKSQSAGVKHKADDDDEHDPRDEDAAPKRRKVWGNAIKAYPGKAEEVDVGDLDALLGRVKPTVGKVEDGDQVKQEEALPGKSLSAIPDLSGNETVATTETEAPAASTVMFKKRKGKK